MKNKSNFLKVFLLLCFVPVFSALVYAQEDVSKFPSRPITFVIANPPGSGTDLMFRIWCKEAEKYLGQPIVPVNKPGGAAVIGTEAINSAKPDGYTVGHFGAASAIIVPLLEKTPYDPIKDLAPIAGMVQLNTLAIANSGSSRFTSWKDLIDYAKQNPKKVTYATTGVNSMSQLVVEKMARVENVQLTHIPFKGMPEMEVALLGGHVDMGVGVFTTSLIEAKKLRPLVMLTDTRNVADFRQFPTVTQLYPGIPPIGNTGIAGPKGIPAGIFKKLEDAFGKALKQPSVIKEMEKINMSIIPLDAKGYAEYINTSYELYKQWIKEMGSVK